MLTGTDSGVAADKAVVRRLIEQVLNGGELTVIDELYTPAMARAARRWIEPFRRTFPDVHMEIVELVAEDDTVVGRFRCSGTHLGTWRGARPLDAASSASTRCTSSGSWTAASPAPGESRTRARAYASSDSPRHLMTIAAAALRCGAALGGRRVPRACFAVSPSRQASAASMLLQNRAPGVTRRVVGERTARFAAIPKMGDPGLEPGTSSLSEKRSNRLS